MVKRTDEERDARRRKKGEKEWERRKAEEEFYRRVGNGPIAFTRPSGSAKPPPQPKEKEPQEE